MISRHIPFATRKLIASKTDQPRSSAEKLLSYLKRCKSVRPVQQIHAQMFLHCISISKFILAKLIDLENLEYSRLVFSHLFSPDKYAFNIFIRGFTTTWKKFDDALEFYYRMRASGLKPDNFTYPFVFISCGNLLALGHGSLAHSGVVKSGLSVDYHVTHSLITMYARCCEIELSRKVFNEIPNHDLVSWNSMISGYSKMNLAKEAVELFGKMMDEGFTPDETTLVTILGACGDLGDLQLGRWVESYIVDGKMELNSYIGSALVDMYGKCRDLQSASRIFYDTKQKNVVTWNALITGYAQNGFSQEVLSAFNAMKVSGVHPDKITMIGVLSACASIGALDLGKQIEEYASQRGLTRDIYVSTALIDMHAKCGSIDQAFYVFDNMIVRNEVAWNAMISALAFHGRATEALSLFKRMLHEKTAPNDITFVAVLSACVHAGLVNEGRRLYNSMTSSFGLVPKTEHKSCMVDLFARAGRVYEAWDFVSQKPDEVSLGALLSACHKLKNADVGDRVIRLLLEMEEPSLNSGNYVISSKIYANENRWDDSAMMRRLMRQKGITKTPGCSWIEMDSQLIEFHTGEHSRGVYRVLDILYSEMMMMMEKHTKNNPFCGST